MERRVASVGTARPLRYPFSCHCASLSGSAALVVSTYGVATDDQPRSVAQMAPEHCLRLTANRLSPTLPQRRRGGPQAPRSRHRYDVVCSGWCLRVVGETPRGSGRFLPSFLLGLRAGMFACARARVWVLAGFARRLVGLGVGGDLRLAWVRMPLAARDIVGTMHVVHRRRAGVSHSGPKRRSCRARPVCGGGSAQAAFPPRVILQHGHAELQGGSA